MPRGDVLNAPDKPIDLLMPNRRPFVGRVAIKRPAPEGPRRIHRAPPLRREQRAGALIPRLRHRKRPRRALSPRPALKRRRPLERPSPAERRHRPPDRRHLDRGHIRLAPRDPKPTALRRRRAAPPRERRVRIPKHPRELSQKLVRPLPRSAIRAPGARARNVAPPRLPRRARSSSRLPRQRLRPDLAVFALFFGRFFARVPPRFVGYHATGLRKTRTLPRALPPLQRHLEPRSSSS